jgi:hypothetical protein
MRTSSIIALTLVLVVGCQGEDAWKSDFDFAWDGIHVSVYGYDRAEDEVCGGSFAALDANTAAILEVIGADDSVHYDYRWMSDAFYPGHCPPGAGACAVSGEAYSRSIPHMHEATHAIIYNAWGGWCTKFLNEGLAEYFSGPRVGHAPPHEPEMARHLLTGALHEREDFILAGHFTSFLFEEYGPEVVKDICQIMPEFTTIADWENAFNVVLGKRIDEVLAEYEAYPVCDPHQYRERQTECDGEADVIYDGHETYFAVDVDCADERALGPIGDSTTVIRRVWFTEDFHVQISFTSGNSQGKTRYFLTQECVPCSEEPQVHQWDSHTLPFYWFRAGMHEFIFSSDIEATDPIIVRMAHPIDH